MRSQLWWKMREALDPQNSDPIALPPDRKLAAELAAPTWTLRGDRLLIESKDEIRARLGSSTDRADAAILAWHERGRALFQRRDRASGKRVQSYAEWDPFGGDAGGGGPVSSPASYPEHDPFSF